ncbi:hypothetical protein ARAM_003212 [Aspergillus rambellii]|uniref:Glucanase n=1 Tax=Aspergillus rambellii TaxID=308745 RepID=A0A0F8VB32_9EURO|nr:hypothetical protein ARAM_003212 [Aspergillus rambellii]
MARSLAALALVALLPLISAQQMGSPEKRPQLDSWKCSHKHGCVKLKTSVVLDAATHVIHDLHTNTSCTTADGTLDSAICPDKETCAKNCVIEGITDYAAHGVTTRGGSMTLRQYLREEDGQLTSVSPRVYLVAEDGEHYNSLHLLGQELSFDVDVSNLPCGMNGALYLSAMLEDGGRSKLNPAGASYGTGYCDAQCFTLPWINGEGNVDGAGSCCNEMDIWEANARAQGLTPHSCNTTGPYQCKTAEECGQASGGVCDKWGCSFNPYALGAHTYYGPRMVVDTTKPFTVVTQFLTNDNNNTTTTTGTLAEIRRVYVQNGKVIQNASCSPPWFQSRGGLPQMGRALHHGMVLAMSIWNDAGGYMQWLDGGDSGPCNATEGAPSYIEQHTPGTSVTFANIRYGDIGSTTFGH